MKLNIRKTFVISLAFFTISLAWTIYNTFVPVFLLGNEQINGLIKSSAVLGVIMTIDNFFGLIFQPFFGTLSDKTKTRFRAADAIYYCRNSFSGFVFLNYTVL